MSIASSVCVYRFHGRGSSTHKQRIVVCTNAGGGKVTMKGKSDVSVVRASTERIMWSDGPCYIVTPFAIDLETEIHKQATTFIVAVAPTGDTTDDMTTVTNHR